MNMSQKKFISLNTAVLTVSDTRTRENDTSGDLIETKLISAGHTMLFRKIVKDDLENLRNQFKEWINHKQINVIISTGGTGLTSRDITPEAVEPLITKPIPGFGELFRSLSYDDIGTSTIESRALAGVAINTLIFLLPGSTGACELGVQKIILPQLDATTRPCNLVALLPRMAHE